MQPIPELPEHGMGLHLVEHLATAWGGYAVPSGQGKVVWFELQTPGTVDGAVAGVQHDRCGS